MPYLLLVCQLLLAAILLFAVGSKLLQSEQFLAALRLSHLPRRLLIPLAVCVTSAEVVVSTGLVLSPRWLLPWFFAGALSLLGSFTLWMIFIYAQKLRIKCGCFGTASGYVGLQSIVRNLLLLIVSLGGFLISFRIHNLLLEPSLWMFMSMLSIEMCLLLLQAFWHAKPALLISLSRQLESN